MQTSETETNKSHGFEGREKKSIGMWQRINDS